MAHIVRELDLHENCKGCNTTTDLYTINCGHMTLCFSCAKVLFFTAAPCPRCTVSVEQLIKEYKVSAHKQQQGVQQATKYMLYMKGFQFLTSPAPNWYPFQIRVAGLKKPPTLQEAQEHLKRNRRNPIATTPSALQVRSCKECGTEKGLHSSTCHHLTLCFQCANVMFLAAAPCPHCLIPVSQLVDEWEEPQGGGKKAQYYTLCEGGYRPEYPDDLATTPNASKDEPAKSKPQALVLKQKEAAPMNKGVVKKSAQDPTSKLKGVVKRSVPAANLKRKGVVERSVIPFNDLDDNVVSKIEASSVKAKGVVKRSVPLANSKPTGVLKKSVLLANSKPNGVVKRSIIPVPVAILKHIGSVNQGSDLEAKKKATLLACGLGDSP